MDSHFLNLPLEIRYPIYEEIFRNVVVLVRCDFPRDCPPMLQKRVSRRYYRASNQVDMTLTLVSRQVRAEAYVAFLATALFDVRFFHADCKRVSMHSQPILDGVRRHWIHCLAGVRRARMNELPVARSSLLHTPYEAMLELLAKSLMTSAITELIIRTRQSRVHEEDSDEALATIPALQQTVTDNMRQFLEEHQHLNIVLEQEIVSVSPGFGPKPVWLTEVRVEEGEGRIILWPEPKRARDFLTLYLEAIGLKPITTEAVSLMA